MRRRCCSPPDSRPIGASAKALASTEAMASATRRARAAIRPPDAPAVAIEAETDEIAAAQRQVPVEGLALGDVADAGVAPPGRPAQDLDGAGAERGQAEHDAQQRGLARPVGTQDGDEQPSSKASDRSRQTSRPP